MKKFDQLTPIGQKRRLNKIARLALENYDLNLASVSYLTEETNVFFKVKDTDGNIYALKIFQEESSAIEDNLAEVYLIDQIQNKTDIEVCSVIQTRDGDSIVVIESDLTPTPKRIALYHWLPGLDLDGHETPERFRELGRITAKMHEATYDLKLPKNIKPKRWDKVFYYRDEVPVYKEAQYQKFLSEDYHVTMDRLIPMLDEELKALYERYESGDTSADTDPIQPQLIHGDLNPWNIRLNQNSLCIIDFEEAMYAYPVHDIAIMLFYYYHDENYDYETVKKDFYEGYTSVRPLPDFTGRDIDMLITARRVNFLNYILQISDDPADYIERNLQRVKAWMNKYA